MKGCLGTEPKNDEGNVGTDEQCIMPLHNDEEQHGGGINWISHEISSPQSTMHSWLRHSCIIARSHSISCDVLHEQHVLVATILEFGP